MRALSPRFRRLVLLACCATAAVNAAELWVAPDGSDKNAGSADAPLASPAAAVRKARELRRLKDPSVADGVRIVLRDGVHTLSEPVWLRPEDSGTAAAPTRIEAAPGARPVLSGGVRLTGWWKPTEDDPRVPAAARGQVWVAPSPVFNGRQLEFRQLWIANRKATRARSPNDGTMERLQGWNRETEEAVIPGSLVAALKSPADAELVVQQQWEIAVLRLRTITRSADGASATVTFHSPESRIEFEHPWPQPILAAEGGAGAFYAVNALEFLDQPGEWFQDRHSGRVYYWPRAGEDLKTAAVIAPALETLLAVEGSLDRPVTHVEVRGVSFQHATWLRPSLLGHVPLQAGMFFLDAYKLRPKGTPDWRSLDNQAWVGRPPGAVVLRAAQHVTIAGCRFEHFAMNGLDAALGTRDVVIEGNIFRDIGGNALWLGSFQEGAIETHLPYDPADEREVCARLRIANNVVTDAANEDWGCVGIGVGYARDTTIEHNEVFNVSYTAISLGWGWTRTANAMRNNRVHANHLHHFATRMCDTAGVYTLSAQPGTVISENSIHSVTMTPYVDRPDHWFYLYTDEGSSFMTVRDNWCEAAKFLENATGPNNVWTNNGPEVSPEIKARAGLEPAFRHLLAQ